MALSKNLAEANHLAYVALPALSRIAANVDKNLIATAAALGKPEDGVWGMAAGVLTALAGTPPIEAIGGAANSGDQPPAVIAYEVRRLVRASVPDDLPASSPPYWFAFCSSVVQACSAVVFKAGTPGFSDRVTAFKKEQERKFYAGNGIDDELGRIAVGLLSCASIIIGFLAARHRFSLFTDPVNIRSKEFEKYMKGCTEAFRFAAEIETAGSVTMRWSIKAVPELVVQRKFHECYRPEKFSQEPTAFAVLQEAAGAKTAGAVSDAVFKKIPHIVAGAALAMGKTTIAPQDIEGIINSMDRGWFTGTAVVAVADHIRNGKGVHEIAANAQRFLADAAASKEAEDMFRKKTLCDPEDEECRDLYAAIKQLCVITAGIRNAIGINIDMPLKFEYID